MRILVSAVGRMRAGPERELFSDYQTRFDRTGRQLGLGPMHLVEVEARGASSPDAEAPLLMRGVPDGARRIVLDERGRQMTSPKFADTLARWRDEGVQCAAFAIGGAAGLSPALRDEADLAMSFGSMVWPHMLARVMLAEQLYRAASILAGSPYHRA